MQHSAQDAGLNTPVQKAKATNKAAQQKPANAQPKPANGKALTRHALSAQYAIGEMDKAELDELCDDIKLQGLIHPIVLYEDAILDGWNRYTACQRTGVEPRFTEYVGDEPVAYLLANLVLRRTLGTVQRGMLAAKIHLDMGVPQQQAAKRLRVKINVVNDCVKVYRSKRAKLVADCLAGGYATYEDLLTDLRDGDIVKPKGALGTASPVPAPMPVKAQAVTRGNAEDGMEEEEGFDEDADIFDDAPGKALGNVDHDAASPYAVPAKRGPISRQHATPAQAAASAVLAVWADELDTIPLDERNAAMGLIWPRVRNTIAKATKNEADEHLAAIEKLLFR